ncbi:hypothetical protein L2E82_49783 [Cichorium intybus]|uniref:Uncharacterized protein n=1 Tax=Cichorium intybus TaxID=13427 RepID=A0ACB8Z0C3_CICIN|nr:hypothetical protein L2E82_49783 [Cichorium intybus]
MLGRMEKMIWSVTNVAMYRRRSLRWQSLGNVQPSNVGVNVEGNEPSSGRTEIINDNNNGKRHVGTERNDKNNGPIENLVSLGCFGPFPSIAQSTAMGDGLTKKRLKERRLKRRRADSGGKCCSPFSNSASPTGEHVGSESIELKSNPCPNQSCVGAPINGDLQQDLEDEVEATVRIGSELGFPIVKEDVVRIQEGEVGGDDNVAQ